MRIAVAATPEVSLPTLDALLQSDHELLFVITQPDRPAGRGQALKESPVSAWCSKNDVACLKPSNTAETLELLAGIDLMITIGYGVLLPVQILNAPRHGCINLHFSLLPRWRGAAPVQRAIEAGDLLSGVTVFKLDEGMDTGPIYRVARFALDADITSDELLIELAEIGAEPVLDSISDIEAGIRPVAQTSEGVTRAMKLSKAESEIDWTMSADAIVNKVRAFTSNPGAWTIFRGTTIKVDDVVATQEKFTPGEIHVIEKALLVGTATSAIMVGFLTPSGKSRTDAKSWLNGARIQSGDHFG